MRNKAPRGPKNAPPPYFKTRAQQPGFNTMSKVRAVQKNTVPNIPVISPAAKVNTPSVPQGGVKLTPKSTKAMQKRLITPPDLNQIRAENLNAQTVAGFRYQLNGIGTSTQTISLPASGKQLLGISINAANIAALADTSITLKVNNRNVVNDAGANQFNANYTLGLLYYPIPQELTGKDTINVIFNKQDAGNITIYLNFVYIPQL